MHPFGRVLSSGLLSVDDKTYKPSSHQIQVLCNESRSKPLLTALTTRPALNHDNQRRDNS
ncbi:hypothetical protein CGRA01v4_05638 [Colletotrichum graminicola]|nr:hypothetical protein CGRA01v4_05638 [Colletotrichum graminicola]